MIQRCCELKAKVVIEDEREVSGRRAILNYGHTYGHAIEAVFGYGEYTHGEAIAIGMTCAARLAFAEGMAGEELLKRQSELFTKMNLPIECPADKHEQLYEAMLHDKKVAEGVLKLVLPTKIGHVDVFDSPGKTPVMKSLNNGS